MSEKKLKTEAAAIAAYLSRHSDSKTERARSWMRRRVRARGVLRMQLLLLDKLVATRVHTIQDPELFSVVIDALHESASRSGRQAINTADLQNLVAVSFLDCSDINDPKAPLSLTDPPNSVRWLKRYMGSPKPERYVKWNVRRPVTEAEITPKSILAKC